MHFTEDKIVQNYDRSLIDITKAGSGCFADQIRWVEQLGDFYDFDINTPYKDLPDKIKHLYLHGSGGKKLPFKMESKNFSGVMKQREFEGIIPHLERAMAESKSIYRRNKITKNYMDMKKCEECYGYRINQQARDVKIGDKHIGELAMMVIEDLIEYLEGLSDEHVKTSQGKNILDKILQKLRNIVDVGLSYLHLNRGLPTLSGGELQRLALMTHLDAGMDSLIYILDEPSMSLHETEKESLIELLIKLKEQGNTVIVVEHDRQFIKIADEIIDIGPDAGENGGTIVFQGSVEDIKKVKESYTGQFLMGNIQLPEKSAEQRQRIDKNIKFITIRNVNTNNLKDLTVKIPLGMMVGICGVSGSGKSSLIQDTLVPLLKPHFKRGINNIKNSSLELEEDKDEDELLEITGTLSGWQNIDEVIVLNQRPIGRSRTSSPISYIGIWDKVRNLFAKLPEAKKRKFTGGHFSFNSDKGRCPECKGNGIQDIQVSFLSAIKISCPECKGKRYKPEILEVKYKDKSIADVLNTTVSEALELFKTEKNIINILKILNEIGMGYITLGQPAPTLSGGEAQRIKLAKELGHARKTKSLYILDEPTVGLSFFDVAKLMDLLGRLVQEGNSVIIIEHDPDILSYTDYIIELGPGGGPKGGEVIAIGTPEEIKNNKNSIIAPYLN
ncbi:MAG: excinuclease ABC subunit UvrA [Promethearchaeota archaeon]